MSETGCRQSAHFHHLVVKGQQSIVHVDGNKYSDERIIGHCISGLTSLVDTQTTHTTNQVSLINGINLIPYDGTTSYICELPKAEKDSHVVVTNSKNFTAGSSTNTLVIRCRDEDIFEEKSYLEYIEDTPPENYGGTSQNPINPPLTFNFNLINLSKNDGSTHNTITYHPIQGDGPDENLPARINILNNHNLFNMGNKLAFVCTETGKWKISSLLNIGVGNDSNHNGNNLNIPSQAAGALNNLLVDSSDNFIYGFKFS